MTKFEEQVRGVRDAGELFVRGLPISISRAPGRLDLMGGNDDYTGGLVFESTIREATWAAVQIRPDSKIVFLNPKMSASGWQARVEFDLKMLDSEETVRRLVNSDPGLHWTAYVLGIFYLLKTKYPDQVLYGADVVIDSNVPLNKGVSSSAAVEVSVMKAASHAYGIDLRGVELAEMCQWVENVITESACGIMDQITVVLGDEGYVLPLVCQPCEPRPLVRLPDNLQCWGVDSGVSHMVSGLEYEAARAAAFMGYRLICEWENLENHFDETPTIPRWTDARWNGYLANISVSEFRSKYETRLPEQMTGAEFSANNRPHVDLYTVISPEYEYRIRANTRYAVEENMRVRLFASLAARAESSDAYELMGELMYQSHHAYTECGLGCEQTDELVELVCSEGAKNGLFGAKITGGGAGGTVAVLGLKSAKSAFDRVIAAYGRSQGITPYVFEGSSIGADMFGVITLEG